MKNYIPKETKVPPLYGDEVVTQRKPSYRPPNKNVRQKNNRPQQSKHAANKNPVFSDNFMDAIGIVAKWVGQIGVFVILAGLSIGAMVIDIGVGTLSLSLSFTHDIPVDSGIIISSGFVAGALSWFTSGIQVFQRIRWMTRRGNVGNNEKYVMYAVMAIDSILDMAAFGYLLTGNTPREFVLSGLNVFDWMIMLIGTGACFIAENLVVYLAGMNTSGKTLRQLFGKRGKK